MGLLALFATLLAAVWAVLEPGGLRRMAERSAAGAEGEAAASADGNIRGRARVIDGDSLEIGGVQIRLYGVDAFEGRQMCGDFACGRAATQAVRDQVRGREVDCQPIDTDRYDRTIAQCVAGGQDLASLLARRGLAVAYRRYSLAYVEDEDHARRTRAGAWATGFTPPEDHRMSER